MKNMFLILFFSTLLISSTSNASNVNDFCVADLKGTNSPCGYNCKPADTVTANDFVFTFHPTNTSNLIKARISTAFLKDFPALSGLDISAVRVVIDKDGFFPLHSHHHATELIIVVEGQITAGFKTATKAHVTKTLKSGDLMVVSPGQLHFVANYDQRRATVFSFFSSSNPSVHSFNNIFANNVPSNVLAQTTFLDVAQVKKLKARFSGGD